MSGARKRNLKVSLNEERFKKDLIEIVEFYQSMVLDPLFPSIEDIIVHQKPEQKISIVYEHVTEHDIKQELSKKKPKQEGDLSKTAIGTHGEQYVLKSERERLINAGREDLADQIRAHCFENEFVGWDITSFTEEGEKIFIEVKSTQGSSLLGFYLSANEWDACQKHPKQFQIYRVMNVLSKQPKVRVFKGFAETVASQKLEIQATAYRVFLKKSAA